MNRYFSKFWEALDSNILQKMSGQLVTLGEMGRDYDMIEKATKESLRVKIFESFYQF